MVQTYSRRSILGITKTAKQKKHLSSSAFVLPPAGEGTGGLEKYSGEWNFDTAAHVLRRATFGATGDQIKEVAALSLETVIDNLFTKQDLPAEPINYYFENDPNVAIGESWVNKPVARADNANMITNSRRRSLHVWQFGLTLTGGLNIGEQMTLFWHNHFVTQFSVVRDPNFMYKYITMLRDNALGNFKELVDLVTIDPAMLRYLNGNQNTNVAPNENYARELLELFAIGKGELAGPNDYTTFTEDDVVEVAKVLTGWRDIGFGGREGQPEPGARFIPNRHDRTTKQLSHRFNNVEISNQGENEYKTLIDIIFEQEEVSKFISRKLYRWFVYYDINDEVEQEIIEPLAEMLRDNNYEIEPALRTLLSSEHFFNICSVGPMIKNPLVFMANLFIQNEINLPPEDDFRRRYQILFRIGTTFEGQQMAYFEPPNVAGWKAYYQEPLFYRTWINSVTLGIRQNLTNLIASGQVRFGDFNVTVDLLDYISKFNDPTDPNSLIDEFVANLFPQPITDEQKDFLKEILIPGLPDFEWTVEYGMFINDPTNEETRRSVDQKLRTFFAAVLSMPEYYLS